MIDYEKLKQCIIMTEALEFGKLTYTNSKHDGEEFRLSWCGAAHPDSVCFNSIDNLFAKLTELTNPKPKYAVGDEVWHLLDKIICSFKVHDVRDIKGMNFYGNMTNGYLFDYAEDGLYPTREALIQAQIDYWSNLRNEELERDIAGHWAKFEGEVKGFRKIQSSPDLPMSDNHCKCGNPLRVASTVCRECIERAVIAVRDDTQRNHREVDVDRCQHEPDCRLHFMHTESGEIEIFRCRKCGELYK